MQRVSYQILEHDFTRIYRSRGSNGLLYTQKKFGWTVTDYTNYQSFWVVHMSVKVVQKSIPIHANHFDSEKRWCDNITSFWGDVINTREQICRRIPYYSFVF